MLQCYSWALMLYCQKEYWIFSLKWRWIVAEYPQACELGGYSEIEENNSVSILVGWLLWLQNCLSYSPQEPENDPRHCCYIWVARGPRGSGDVDTPTMLTLYQLSYGSKDTLPGYGVIYRVRVLIIMIILIILLLLIIVIVIIILKKINRF